MNRSFRRLLAACVFPLLIGAAACAGPQRLLTPAPVHSPTPPPVPTRVPATSSPTALPPTVPSPTPLPTNTATPTHTPIFTPTITLTPTPTLSPTPAPPIGVQLVTPQINALITQDTVLFQWTVDPFATKYHLSVKVNAGKAVIDQVYGQSICQEDLCSVSASLENGVYSWQVESSNALGSVPSGYGSFSRSITRLAGLALGGQVSDSLTHADLMRSAAMSWVKYQIVWTVTPASTARVLIESAHREDFKILLSITGPAYPESMDSAGYLAYLEQVAVQQPDAIEVWNEMNLDTEWPAGQISPAAYVSDLLAPAYNVIKRHSPDTIVISGALASTGVDDGIRVWNDKRYAIGMARAGAAQYADCIGFHYNAGATSPRAISGHPADQGDHHYSWYFAPTAEVYRSAFGRSRPLCLTEIGYLSAEGYPPLPADWFWAYDTSVAEQAAWLADGLSYAREMGDIRLVIVWNVDFTTWTDDPKGGFAILRPDGTCPACSSLYDALQ